MSNAFSKVNAGDIVIINKQILFEIIEKRIYETKVKIEDLFLLCKAPQGLEGDQLVDTPYGKLRVFFINKDLKKSWLLHKFKYEYPKISKVRMPKTKLKLEIPGPLVDLDSLANSVIKSEYKN